MRVWVLFSSLLIVVGCNLNVSMPQEQQEILNAFNWKVLNENPPEREDRRVTLPNGNTYLIKESWTPLKSYNLNGICKTTGASTISYDVENDVYDPNKPPRSSEILNDKMIDLTLELHFCSDRKLLEFKKKNGDIHDYLYNFEVEHSDTNILVTSGLDSLSLKKQSKDEWHGYIKKWGITQDHTITTYEPIVCVFTK